MSVLVVGSLNIDMAAYVRSMPKPGETVYGEKLEIFPGGKGLNQATAAPCRWRCHHGGGLRHRSKFEGVCGTAIIEVDTSGQNGVIVILGACSVPPRQYLINYSYGSRSSI